MAADKKINELPISNAVAASDISVLVRDGTDYQFSFDAWLEFIDLNITSGSGISFGTSLPQNNSGKNGDIFFNTSANNIAQKISGNWVIKYNLPTANGLQDGTVLYGSGNPGSAIGKNGDTYIDTLKGIFYQRNITNTWLPVFSMQTGPAGPKGEKGDAGQQGFPGKTILNGSVNPSNLTTGDEGDFYLNVNTLAFFGPKKNGNWGEGILLTQRPPDERYIANTDMPVLDNWQDTDAAVYGNFPRVTLLIEDENGNEVLAPGSSPIFSIDRTDPQNPLVTSIRWELAFATNCRILIN